MRNLHGRTSPFIIKVQWPLSTTLDVPPILIYNEDRSIKELIPATEEWRKLMKGRVKVYFYATLTEPDGTLTIGEIAPDQSW